MPPPLLRRKTSSPLLLMGYPIIILPPNLVLEGPLSPESFRTFNPVDRFLLVAVLLNPIEHLWHHIKLQLCKYEAPAKGVWQIWERVAEVWNDIEPDVCQNLIESMPRRVEAVIKAKGGNTKY